MIWMRYALRRSHVLSGPNSITLSSSCPRTTMAKCYKRNCVRCVVKTPAQSRRGFVGRSAACHPVNDAKDNGRNDRRCGNGDNPCCNDRHEMRPAHQFAAAAFLFGHDRELVNDELCVFHPTGGIPFAEKPNPKHRAHGDMG